ncbi:DUF4910 domain-containing protein [Marinihelvus fidelis]|uniref:DUF4910 domain-containing protein n=1 Tax=Marinihelvus fidelis TaxID=2613842 RepID=A0A5N0T940_9GAMM|nr:DUF4910 domain-containing protein [Marinihelvus fidelis]KAA9131535.1 DUF4910 domain-containing protein [Marinihelvus fidelis]
MNKPSVRVATALFALAIASATTAQPLPQPEAPGSNLESLVEKPVIEAIADEVSGVAAKRNLDTLTLYHRTRASSQFRQAAVHVLDQLKAYGFDNAQLRTYPADGDTMFGTQKSRPAWDVEFAELWELDADGQRVQRHGSWDAMPLSVAQDSVSGRATAALVDIGVGTDPADYEGKDIAGKLVLTESQPGAVQDLAVTEHGAAGIISYAPNQKSAWWKEDDRLVRWGHLDSFKAPGTFAFMVNLRTANQWKARLAAGETITLDAEVRATREPGEYVLVDAAIKGASSDDEIIYTCHLDHPRPSANDNASGCVAELEAARVLKVLIDQGRLPRPARTLRFIWPAEIEGSLIYLVSRDDTDRIKANIHLDMVGGAPVTKSVFRIAGGPMSLPTFISDVGHEIGRFVNDQTLAYASGEGADFPLVSAEGSKNPQLAVMEQVYSMGSDHQVFQEGSYRIPGIYLHDWPDRYIHTNFDTAANIDPTKLKRAAFIVALQGYYLAAFGEDDVEPLTRLLAANALARARDRVLSLPGLAPMDRVPVMGIHWQHERGKLASINAFAPLPEPLAAEIEDQYAALETMTTPKINPAMAELVDLTVYTRNPDITGPMDGFGYSYQADRLDAETAAGLALPYDMTWEALNLVDGQRTVTDIRRWLVAQKGDVALEAVAGYLAALAEIGVVRER